MSGINFWSEILFKLDREEYKLIFYLVIAVFKVFKSQQNILFFLFELINSGVSVTAIKYRTNKT